MFSTIITWFLLFLCTCLLIWSFQKILDKIKHLPPGPFRFPIIGCMPQVLLADLEFPFVAFEKLTKTYGNIIYVQIGLVKGVVINGYDALTDVYRNEDWIGRLDDKFMIDRTFGKPYGLLSGHVDIWKETRHFSSRVLREFGFGVKKSMECLIQEELENFSTSILERIEKAGGVIVVNKLFNMVALNITWSMISGTRFRYDDKKLVELLGLLDDFLKSGSMGAGLLTVFPFLYDWAPKLVGVDIQAKANRGIHKYLREFLSEIRSQGDYLTNPSNFIEVYLQKIETRASTGNLDDIVYSEENLISVLYDFFGAGSETSGNTLAFGLLHLVLNQDVQEKLRNEVDIVIGRHRSPELTDREKMPYTSATILEIFRTSIPIPIAGRKLHKDATLGKYRFTKGTMVYMNLHSAGMEKEFWGDPENFRPERFLSPEGKIINADRLILFGAGKRNCLGESVARSTVFIMLTGLVQKFKFDINPAEGKPTRKPKLGFTLSPTPFTTVVTPRHAD